MRLSRKKLRALIESVIAEEVKPTRAGLNRAAYHRRVAKEIDNKDKAKAEKIMNQIKGADWNAGYEVEIVVQDKRIDTKNPLILTPIGHAINKFAPGPDTKYGIQITGFSTQKEADQFAEIVRQKLNIRAVSIKGEMLVIVDPADSVSSTYGMSSSDGTRTFGQSGTSGGGRPYTP